jgi:hypothetical protein
VQLSEGFELTEHSLNELGNGRVDMWLAPTNRQDAMYLGPFPEITGCVNLIGTCSIYSLGLFPIPYDFFNDASALSRNV